MSLLDKDKAEEVVTSVVDDDEDMLVETPEEPSEPTAEAVGVSEVTGEDEDASLLVDEVEEDEDIPPDVMQVEADVDFGSEYLYVQEGVYYDTENDVVLVEDVIFEGVADSEGKYEYETGKVDKHGKPVIRKLEIKKFHRKKKKKGFDIGLLRDEDFGELLPLIKDKNVTDINWNGSQCWVDDVNKGRYLSDIKLSKDFTDVLSIRIANVVSKTFNRYAPALEAETADIRITVMHESISRTGRAVSIRKTPAIRRIDFFGSIQNGEYCTVEVANLMSNCVKAKMNVIVCGLPGVGKTELVKFLTNYIMPSDRAITVEDTLEIHYSDINPGKDCLEFKISPQFSYTDAIKSSLRLLPQWVLLSEARSVEVRYLIESVSTGTKCMTTLHADDVRKIPDRVVNMIGDMGQADLVENSVYNFFDVGILIDKKIDKESGRIVRWISQLCVFSRYMGKNECVMLVEDGKLTGNKMPEEFMRRFNIAGIADPYKYTFI